MANQIDVRFLRTITHGDREVMAKLANLYQELLDLKVEGVALTPPPLQGIRNLLFFAAQQKKLTIIATGCPDYSTEDGHYTFKNLGEDVSVLPRLHLKVARKLLPLLEKHKVDYAYYLLIADLAEGTDEAVVAKFCQGKMDEFLRRCECTRQKLALMIEEQFPESLARKMQAGSFSSFYGPFYSEEQKEYVDMVLAKAEEEINFSQAFLSYHVGRIDLYRRFLSGYNNDPTQDQLRYRSARGIAQYLAHFNLARLRFEAPIMINHRTISLQWINRTDLARNEKEERELMQKPRVPVFVIENKVY